MKKRKILKKRTAIADLVDELGRLYEEKELTEKRISEVENEIKKRAESEELREFAGQYHTIVVERSEIAQINSKILYEFMADMDMLSMYHACVGVKVQRVQMLLTEKEFKNVACCIVDEYGKITITKKEMS